MKNLSRGQRYTNTISRVKALLKEEQMEISNIFVELDDGTKKGGFTSISEAEKCSDKVYISLRLGKVLQLKQTA
jgi:hypothetical protein